MFICKNDQVMQVEYCIVHRDDFKMENIKPKTYLQVISKNIDAYF